MRGGLVEGEDKKRVKRKQDELSSRKKMKASKIKIERGEKKG